MKRVYILAIISLILVTPNIVFAEGEYCADQNLRRFRKEIGQINYEYVIDYDSIEDIKNNENSDTSEGYINLSVNGLTSNYSAIMQIDDRIYEISSEPAKLSGGVKKIYFYNNECPEDVIKEEELFLPYYNKNNIKPFDDGSVISKKKSIPNIVITAVLSVIVVGLFVISIFVIKKGRKK